MALLALDWGEKRVGAAISRSGIIAEPLETIIFDENFYSKLEEICHRERIKKIIIGLPRSLKGKENTQEKRVREEAEIISREMNLGVELVDERFTSKIAESRFGTKRIDEESAVVILEAYLEQKKAMPDKGSGRPPRPSGGRERNG